MSNTALRLTYYNIADGVCAFSTTRHSGTSEGNHASLNINPYCGDKPEHVAANRTLLAEELGVDADRIILPHQTHGTETRIIGKEFCTLPEQIRQMLLEGVDALLTDVKGVCIGVSTADCIPILLYDEEHHAAAAVHAGWRGTLARIVGKAVIGPGISLDHFEVGDEVYEAFEQAAFPMEEIAEQRPNAAFSVDPAERERLAAEGNIVQPLKWHLNLPLCNRQILLHCGVAEENIQDCGICTFAHSDEYFSARKLGIESGRIFTGILLK